MNEDFEVLYRAFQRISGKSDAEFTKYFLEMLVDVRLKFTKGISFHDVSFKAICPHDSIDITKSIVNNKFLEYLATVVVYCSFCNMQMTGGFWFSTVNKIDWQKPVRLY